MENLEITIEDHDVISRLNERFSLPRQERQIEKDWIRRLLCLALKLEPKDLHAMGISRRQVLSLSSRLFLGFYSFIPRDEEVILKALS